ncbi:MAG: hypothetical protein HY343_09445 [Lentisphaerae bacterium]|nr:hypothetical protein [Lentisphaerota bacterium]
MTDQRKAVGTVSETEIWNAIAAFEKILEALPNDRVSLETLSDAYEKVGDRTRAKEYLLRLATVFLDEADEDGARDLLRKIKPYDDGDPQVAQVISRIEQFKPEKVMAVVMDGQDASSRRSVNIADEISFAWNLLQSNKLTQEDYSAVVHDLSENSTKNTDIPVSTLHVLHDRTFAGLSDILAYVAKDRKLPFIALTGFDVTTTVAGLLPMDFMIKRKAIVFDIMNNDVLVAILNPYDTQLQQEIEDLTEKTSHLYLTSSPDFDATLDKLKKAEADSKNPEKKKA